jgi:hypothetical protein
MGEEGEDGRFVWTYDEEIPGKETWVLGEVGLYQVHGEWLSASFRGRIAQLMY